MRKFTGLVAFLTASAIPVTAAAQYQIIPVYVRDIGSGGRSHWALIINEGTGETRSCQATTQIKDPVVGYINCRKDTVESGSMPHGPAAFSPVSPVSGGPSGPNAMWKVDQSNGEVTFCGTRSSWGYGLAWHCVQAP